MPSLNEDFLAHHGIKGMRWGDKKKNPQHKGAVSRSDLQKISDDEKEQSNAESSEDNKQEQKSSGGMSKGLQLNEGGFESGSDRASKDAAKASEEINKIGDRTEKIQASSKPSEEERSNYDKVVKKLDNELSQKAETKLKNFKEKFDYGKRLDDILDKRRSHGKNVRHLTHSSIT